MEDTGVVSHWCYVCSQTVNPLTEAEIKCPQCESKFLQQMRSPRMNSQNAMPNAGDRVPIWSPILLGLIGAAGDEDSPPNLIASAAAHISSDVDQAEEHSAEGFIKLSFGRNLHDDPSSERRSMDLEDDWERSTEGILLEEDLLLYSEEARSSLADYFSGTDLDVLQQHLLGVDRHSRFYESVEAGKAVDAMPMVTIKENMHCSICLEDFEMGEEAKETRCKHRFHGWCIFSWLELHRSCPLCRCRISPDSASRRLPLIG
ncbi:E3 ubiquitin-protein ligase SIRP1-like [Rhodamnia argentea]|uniref:RING-type E3 ubiquitin transferase n=1 Tax=Rhodamnia argentea TaxID=178133 RepID=A0ABM3GRM3_9MYRT|nr:E3 ubiquitin-protein ligase SIRP1-like [Rhodamnia argentea]